MLNMLEEGYSQVIKDYTIPPWKQHKYSAPHYCGPWLFCIARDWIKTAIHSRCRIHSWKSAMNDLFKVSEKVLKVWYSTYCNLDQLQNESKITSVQWGVFNVLWGLCFSPKRRQAMLWHHNSIVLIILFDYHHNEYNGACDVPHCLLSLRRQMKISRLRYSLV